MQPNVHIVSELEEDFDGYRIGAGSGHEALSRVEERHFWHRSRNELIAASFEEYGVVAPDRVLELGCGSGAVAAFLARRGFVVTGVDGHRTLVELAAQRAPSATFFVHDLRRGVPAQAGRNFDGVGLFDVIEHLDSPLDALQTAIGLLRPGGVLLGTVPALMQLWSRVDEVSGHRLRYDRAGLERLLLRLAGGNLLTVRDFNRHLVPAVWLQRKLVSRRGRQAEIFEANFELPASFLNEALVVVGRCERVAARVLEHLPVPGASLLFAVRRQG